MPSINPGPSLPGKPLVIALLTPYSGRNLGDGAIQSAFIQNLQALRPEVELIGITENPARTEAIHGIRCFPLHALARAAAVQWGAPARIGGAPPSSAPPPRSSGLRAIVGAIPLARPAVAALRRLRRMLDFRDVREAVREWRLLGRVDLLLVAGGGQLDEEWGGPWSQPFVLFRWSALARARGVTVAVASVGMGVLQTRLSRRFVKRTLARSHYRSFRDKGTRQLLARFTPSAGDPIVPDVALSLPLPAGFMNALPAKAGSIGVVPIVFGHPRHWPTVDVPAYERYVRELA
ncbi:MAG TPA: polysaccharide pyruvyl transferase family protein, partial [Steroidobacteraceae bacterium]|nr:polysaccharide pyruvyl transferase family protein [Steroidobacteraceae bacterium]